MSAPSPTDPPRPSWRLWGWFALVGTLLVANLFAFVRQNAVGLPFSDQWDLHELVWRNAPAGELFMHQHGPHRQGVFFPLTSLVLQAAHGDIRIESVWIASWLVVAALLAFWLPRRFTGRWHAADVLPLAWGLSLLQNETITTTGNLSHSIGPLVLVLLAAHAQLLERVWWRWSLLAGLGAGLLFTGFGLFGAVVLTALALVAVARPGPERRPAAGALLLLVAAWWLFLSDYHFNPAAPNFHFPHSPLWEYAPFLALMFATPCGFPQPGTTGGVVGLVVLCSSALAFGLAAGALRRRPVDSRRPALLLFLLGTALLFALNTAIGRVQLGVSAGMAPRYGSLLVPAFLALFLLARTAGRGQRRLGLTALAFLALWPYRDVAHGSAAPGTWGLPRAALEGTRIVCNAKLAWLHAFAATGDTSAATAASRAEIYPPAAAWALPGKVARLRALRWVPFRNGPVPSGYQPFAGAPAVVFVGFHPEDEDQHWLAEDAALVVDGRQGRWLNLEISDRFAALPAEAPLQLDLAGRRAVFARFGQGAGLSLPLTNGAEQVVQLTSPAGARRPVDTTASTDDRALSFRLGRVSVDATPLFPVWTRRGEKEWVPERAIIERRGFHGWEQGFGWMNESLELTVEITAPTWLDLRCTGRFPALPGTGGLCVSLDGGPESALPLDHGKGAVSVELLVPGRHQLRLRSEDGATSPQACGLSKDPRNLSFRIAVLDLAATPAFPLIVRPLSPSPKP